MPNWARRSVFLKVKTMPEALQTHPADALDDPLYRIQMQGLKDMTAAIDGVPTSPVVFSIDPGSVLNQRAGNSLSNHNGAE